MDGGGAARGDRAVRVRRHGICLSRVLLRERRLLGTVRGAQFELAAAAVLQGRGAVGCSRGLVAAVDLDSVRLECRGGSFQPWVAPELFEPGARRHGPHQFRLHAVYLVDLEPLSALDSGGSGRGGFESGAAGLRTVDSSAHALHGLRRFLGRVRFCLRGHAGRPARSGLGEMDAALDDFCLAVSNHRHCLGQLVGLLRIGLGRLVVLGSG